VSEREPYPADDEAETTEPAVPESLPADVPEADAIEQAAPLDRVGGDEPATVGDAPEADALEQHTDVGDADDEYRG